MEHRPYLFYNLSLAFGALALGRLGVPFGRGHTPLETLRPVHTAPFCILCRKNLANFGASQSQGGMNSLRVGGLLSWRSYRKEMAPGRGRSLVKRRCCRHYVGLHGQHIGRFVSALHEAIPFRIKRPFTPSSTSTFLPRSVTCMNMEFITGFFSPLGLDKSSIQDTLVCMLVPLLGNSLSCVTQKLAVIGGAVETARRASMLAWNGFVDCLYPLWK